MKPKIYIAHSSGYDFIKNLYQPIKNSKLWETYEFILPHDNRDYHPDSKKEIQDSKVIIAEISHPSTGAGIEIGWADSDNKPIIFIHNHTYNPPAYFNTMTPYVIKYNKPDEIPNLIKQVLEELI